MFVVEVSTLNDYLILLLEPLSLHSCPLSLELQKKTHDVVAGQSGGLIWRGGNDKD